MVSLDLSSEEIIKLMDELLRLQMEWFHGQAICHTVFASLYAHKQVLLKIAAQSKLEEVLARLKPPTSSPLTRFVHC
jgi:hypothetical protein